MPPDNPLPIAIIGPTASGKTGVGVAIARAIGGEIISADSRQVYRGLDIGTGKDLHTYREGGEPVPYHLIDIADPVEEYNVYRFQQECYDAVEAIQSRGKRPIIVGGTGLYVESVLLGYAMTEVMENEALRAELAGLSGEELVAKLESLRPSLHNTTDTQDRERTVRAIEIAMHEQNDRPAREPLDAIAIGLQWPPYVLRARIRQRLEARLAAGLVEEVQGLLDKGIPEKRLHELGLEYRFIPQYMSGEIKNKNDLVQKLSAAIAQFAKRQRSFFRRMERRGAPVHWIDGDDAEAAIAHIHSRTVAP